MVVRIHHGEPVIRAPVAQAGQSMQLLPASSKVRILPGAPVDKASKLDSVRDISRKTDKRMRKENVFPTPPLILALDVGGRPVDWIHWRAAVLLVLREEITWATGTSFPVYGGINHVSGERSCVQLNTIIAVRNANAFTVEDVTPPLSNAALFRRDRYTCMYCGDEFVTALLTRDHVIPRSRGGEDCWSNCVTACRACNQEKSDRTPEEVGLELLALPFVPSRIEALVLANRRVLADQMEFLERHLPRQRCGSAAYG